MPFEICRTGADDMADRGDPPSGLGLVKSAVSRRIRNLEDRLGTRLINRTTRQLSLTEAGTLFG
jgi:Bacterial regulatory helix-turn-helix protein, lysR family